MLFWIHILRSPPLHYDHGEVWFFPHKYTRYTMNITCTYAKIKKIFKPQPPRASLMPSWIWVFVCLNDLSFFITPYQKYLSIITEATIIEKWLDFRRWLCHYIILSLASAHMYASDICRTLRQLQIHTCIYQVELLFVRTWTHMSKW